MEENDQVDYLGLTNEGTTCYLNSLLQTLFFIRPLRNAIYQVDTESFQRRQEFVDRDETKIIPFCMQRIFYNLQRGDDGSKRVDSILERQTEVRTHELLNALGWENENRGERLEHKDVNEFNDFLLGEKLEMERSVLRQTCHRLFQGTHENVIQCINVKCSSVREEIFTSIPLDVMGHRTIEDSIRTYISSERLEGDN